MRISKKWLSTALLTIVVTACQQNTYKIVGETEGLNDGDTLVLVQNQGETQEDIVQKFVVEGGSFEVEGEVGPGPLCTIYAPGRYGMGINLFLEAGTIRVKLTPDEAKNHVGGTKSNDAWQEMNSKIAQYNDKMQQLAKQLYDEKGFTEETQKQAVEQMQQLEADMVNLIVTTAEKNYDNEVGYFLITNFEADEQFAPTKRLALIKKMPSRFRERKELKEMVETLEKAQSMEEGSKIQDFSLPAPDGQELSVMSIVKENKLTILDFWASWCGPCRQEMPNMVQLYDMYQPKGLAIIGISLDENHDQWVKAIEEMGMKWPQMSDLKGWNSAAAQQFRVRAIPHIIILDQKGCIVGTGLRGEQLMTFIDRNLE